MSDKKNILSIQIENCKDCQFHHVEGITTPDSFEHESGVYCSKCKDPHPYAGARTDDRLVCSDDWDPRKYSEIPDWCPLLEQNNQEKKLVRIPIAVPYKDAADLKPFERAMLVKGISIDSNVWVEGFYVKKKSGRYPENGGRFEEFYEHVIITDMSDGGFQYARVIPESICRCTGRTTTDGEYFYEGDYLDDKGYNQIEGSCTGQEYSVNGDRPLWEWLNDNKEHKIYGNRYDYIIIDAQEAERVKA